ncbi:hypothetical protein [Microvirga pudoricolor]|uniref:hypothetical protein n=1 Tax=Microvirga pudoricolor TaxID=2778729 RepID=UPI0019512B06|nr:hypothetical protein [Microvirga pudoricolor]MBM6594358.1 hypothetical protein [Microvirga pudoricolor]
MHHAVQAAIARFPDRGHAIAELATADDGFLSLCEDLVEAQEAVLHWERSTSPLGAARSDEYRELVKELVAELERTLDRSTGA